MTRTSGSLAVRVGGLVVVTSALVLALTACDSPNPVAATHSATPSSEPSATATAAPTSTEVTGIPLNLTCADILSSDALYALKGGMNYDLDPNYAPKSSTTAAAIAALKGVTCGYVNQTSGETFSIAVAQITPNSMDTLKTHLVETLTPSSFVPSYAPNKSTEGYFKVSKGVGEAQIATANYWISIASDTFSEPGEVEQIVQDVEKALGQ